MKDEIRVEVGDFIKEQILLSVSKASSPIAGGKYKSTLSKEYKKEKQADGLPGIANMENSGLMLDSLEYRSTASGIEIGVYGKAAERADGHNNFSGSSNLPERQFLPMQGDKFKSEIQKEVERIIRDKIADKVSVSRRTFATISSKDELWETLNDLFPSFSRKEIAETVMRSRELAGLLDEFNLLRYLRGED